MNSLFETGKQRALEQSDFLPLSKENHTSFVTENLQESWRKEERKCHETRGRPKLWKSVIKTISLREVMILICMGIFRSFFSIPLPLLLGYLISALMLPDPQEELLYGCALALCFSTLIERVTAQMLRYRCELLAIRIGSALKALVYHKTLLLSKDTLLQYTTGKVITLVSNDVQRLEGETIKWIFLGFISLIELLSLPLLMVYLIGWQSLMGVLFLYLLLPYFALLSQGGAVLRLRTAAVSDQRISLLNQVISGIRSIKMHAWEDEYRQQVRKTRRNEISSIRKMWALRAGVLALRCSSVTIATLLSVIALVLTEETLTPVNVFMMISFNNMLSICICTFLAFALLDGYEAHASIGRIEEFLLVRNLRVTSSDRSSRKETEIEAKNSCDKKRSSVDFQKKLGDFSIVNELQDETILRVRSLTYKQMERRDSYILQDIELCTTTSSLTVITRPVGSGKSTLLSVIAGEVSFTQGEVSCQGTVAYVPQTTWVFTGTIQDNILFGLSHEEVKYTRVIEACALTDDIQQFPDSDQTLVGQRGVALSGGQRARVSLARAVYANADVYLLDDPLSAVDFKVGQHIFDKCIKELLIGKTRMMVSHHEDHMKDADEVIVLCKGRVMERGSFLELQDKGIFHKTTDPQYKKISTEGNSGGKFVREIENESVRSAGCLVGIESPSKETRSLLTPQEDREIGVISSKLYWNYFRSGMYTWMIVATTLFSVTAQGMLVAPDVWLSFATKQPLQDQKDQSNLAMYGCLVGVSLMFILARTFVLLSCFLLCSERLHDNMVFAILQAPVVFFDSNPVGRILNRFSKDIGCLDEQLPRTFQLAIDALLIVLASTIVPTIINPWLTFVLIPLIVVAIYLSTYYLKTSRELMRLASICRSPVFSHISETLDGLETIRTRGRQSDFVDQFYRHQDLLNQANILVLASGKWISVRFEILASLFVGAVALLAVYVSQDAAFAGLALAYVVQRFGRTHYAVQKTSEVENLMTAVERVFTNTKLGCEPGYVIERRPPENWPNKGNIIFKDVSLTYYLGGSQVLKNIKVNIKGGAKIGVAGRTGAGKSSFVAALMRMPESSGEIIIDGIPIKQINLHETRRCISVLGQSPVLFSGSLRKNLDIIEQFTDADLWQVLKDVQLKEFVKSVHGNLDHEQLENGANISVGERQLICLARVLLQRNKIVVLDEPTANVDPKTEQTIWGVVREKLRDSTVITIAHRLNTIKDCDKVLVLKHGMVAEFDELDTLVNTEESELGETARVATSKTK
ncbi:multidrug resistance-associated protein 4-like [Stylophora pistillata]|uniref:multidrug resistance-associated protein 4-like n=1 Tax=Stylophora pistillata TaxID=50429 RepID=UPI000C047080|nr:multidrug resistance-associated protein 4-like [Stylophora pistillata]